MGERLKRFILWAFGPNAEIKVGLRTHHRWEVRTQFSLECLRTCQICGQREERFFYDSPSYGLSRSGWTLTYCGKSNKPCSEE